MTPRSTVRMLARWCVGLAWLVTGCGDKITVNTPGSSGETLNQAPRIVAQGPAWGSSPIDVGRVGSPQPYVLVADDNGIDDIAGAYFSVETAILRGFISRPDSIPGGTFCTLVWYSNTVDIRAFVPTTFSSVVTNCPMFRGQGATNYFTIAPFEQYSFGGTCSALPRIDLASPYFGVPVSPCGPADVFSHFGIYPPAVPAPYDVNITYLDVEYTGIRATVYDAAGASATVDFPNLRLIYTSRAEREFPP